MRAGTVVLLAMLLGMAACAPAGVSRAQTGVVQGNLDACAGMVFPGTPQYSPGTVAVYPAPLYATLIASGQRVLRDHPQGRIASMRVTPEHGFSFTLRQGTYTLVGTYAGTGAVPHVSSFSFRSVSIAAGRTLHEDLPDLCK